MWMREDFTYTDLNDIKEHLESVSFIHCLVRDLLVPIKWSIKAECLNGLGLTVWLSLCLAVLMCSQISAINLMIKS